MIHLTDYWDMRNNRRARRGVSFNLPNGHLRPRRRNERKTYRHQWQQRSTSGPCSWRARGTKVSSVTATRRKISYNPTTRIASQTKVHSRQTAAKRHTMLLAGSATRKYV